MCSPPQILVQNTQVPLLDSPINSLDPKRLLRSLQAGTPAHERGRKGDRGEEVGGREGQNLSGDGNGDGDVDGDGLVGADAAGVTEVGSSSGRVGNGHTIGEKKKLGCSIVNGVKRVGIEKREISTVEGEEEGKEEEEEEVEEWAGGSGCGWG